MTTCNFLVEIGTEELPPKSLKNLSDAFVRLMETRLHKHQLSFQQLEPFCTPRRLALRIQGLQRQQADRLSERRGPAIKAARDADGNPTPACLGFARSCGTTPEQLETLTTPKGSWLVFRSMQAGKTAESLLPGMITETLNQLPIARRMRWGSSRVEFVRPVHWVVMLLDEKVLPADILGKRAGNQSQGHRFHCPDPIDISSPMSYEKQLEATGKVIASFDSRRELIREAVTSAAKKAGGTAVIDPELLDEVTALNEWPQVLVGHFDTHFLAVPREALISSMKTHQKYFHVEDAEGRILPLFIAVSNIDSSEPERVIEGNERVIRPRLADAAFFFSQDCKRPLSARVDELNAIVFQHALGSLGDRVGRVSRLAGRLAEQIGGDSQLGERAGLLSKADLVTEMVQEFPELQGIMGYHYALKDGENADVALAIREQYLPRFAGDALPTTHTGCALAIAEKLDSLCGLFGINQPPKGDSDPFALRRAALGVLRIIVENQLPIDLKSSIRDAIGQYDALPNKGAEQEVLEYMMDRFYNWYEEKGVTTEVVNAVMARRPTRPLDFDRRIHAVNAFIEHPSAPVLSLANKRVGNILAKQKASDQLESITRELLVEPAEKALYRHINETGQRIQPLLEKAEYAQALDRLAELADPISRFFDDVMVVVDDTALRNNRLALLSKLHHLFLQVADISRLQGQTHH